MRLFAAVLPPDHVVRELATEVAKLKRLPGSEGLRWTNRPGWHFTLAFYGEVPDDLVPGLADRLSRVARRTDPFDLALSGGGQFGHGKAVWTGAYGEVEAMRRLAERAEAAARRAGLPMEEHRRYTAHLTVARSRDGVDTRPYVGLLRAFTGTTWTVSELALVRSNLPRSGVPGEPPRYEVVARWALGGSG